ncbi:CpsD/CapB family tyrosine-protein kinase [Halalkalibacter alkalisediminis]|uniref:non-specific protein-tyrosine kinase n=2 Tax=Halalkalibacter alkalisediminis TaxID=935616 RepID=A0ABV6NH10_9BACI
MTINKNLHSIVADEYDTIRENIEFASFENNYRSIMITSPTYGEGKSITTANLAISLAQNSKKVLIIDANIRNPSIHQIFKIKNTIGLTNVLIGQKALEETLNQTEFGRIGVVTSGPIPNNSEKLFRSVLLEQLLDKAKELYDYVLIDVPPVLEENDSKIMASLCDGVILVVRNGKTEDALALEAKKSLVMVHANLLGVILNGKRTNPILRKLKI